MNGGPGGSPKVKEVLLFDTEFTAWAGSMARNWKGPGEYKEIVQIGAISIDAKEMKETGSFCVLIRPVKNPVLSSYFERLTGITNERLAKEALTFAEGISRFLLFAAGRPSFCYGRDDRIIAENAALLDMRDLWSFDPSVNLRIWLERVGVPLAGVHSGELAAHVGSVSQGRAHDALTDARSLAEAVRYLVARGAPNPYL